MSTRQEKTCRPIKVTGHRGAAGHEPENTLLSFQKAIEIGVNAIELDVRLSKDGEVVILHDRAIDRTTNGKGFVKDFTLSELKQLDAGKGQKIPTLKETFNFVKDVNVVLQIELKQLDNESEESRLIKLVTELIKNQQREEKVVVTSFSGQMLKKVKSENAIILTGLLISDNPDDPIGLLESVKADRLHVRNKSIDQMLVTTVHRHGTEIAAWGQINDIEDIDEMIGLSVDSIGSDYPDRVIGRLKFFQRLA